MAEVADAPDPGVVSGTYTIDGLTSDLRYAYARRGEDKVQVVLSTIALDPARVVELVEGRYRGMKKLAGVLLTVDAHKEKHWDTQFIGEQGLDGSFGMTSSGGQDPMVVENRIIGRVALRNQSAAHQRSFLANFDVPLSAASADERCTPKAQHAFQRLVGRWQVARWSSDGGSGGDMKATDQRGSLRIDERLGPTQFLGTLLIVPGHDLPDIAEQLSIVCQHDRVVVRGAVPPESPWSPDSFELEASGDRLTGGGRDVTGHSQTIEFRRAR